MSKRAQQQPPAASKNPPPNSIWGNKRTGAEAQVLRTEYDRARWRVRFWLEGTPEGAQQEMPRAQFLKAFALKGVPPAGGTVPPAPKGLPHQTLLAQCHTYAGQDPKEKPAVRASKYAALARWVAWVARERLPCGTYEEVLHAVNAFESDLEDRGAQRSTRKGYAAALHEFLAWHRERVAVRVPPEPRPDAHSADSPKDMQLKPALVRYIAEKSLSERGIGLWEYCIMRRFERWALASKARPTVDLAGQSVEIFLATLRANGHSEDFVAEHRRVLASFCSWWTGEKGKPPEPEDVRQAREVLHPFGAWCEGCRQQPTVSVDGAVKLKDMPHEGCPAGSGTWRLLLVAGPSRLFGMTLPADVKAGKVLVPRWLLNKLYAEARRALDMIDPPANALGAPADIRAGHTALLNVTGMLAGVLS